MLRRAFHCLACLCLLLLIGDNARAASRVSVRAEAFTASIFGGASGGVDETSIDISHTGSGGVFGGSLLSANSGPVYWVTPFGDTAQAHAQVWSGCGAFGFYSYGYGGPPYGPGEPMFAGAIIDASFSDVLTFMPPAERPDLLGVPGTFSFTVSVEGDTSLHGVKDYFSITPWEGWNIWDGYFPLEYVIEKSYLWGEPSTFGMVLHNFLEATTIPGWIDLSTSAKITNVQAYDASGTEIRGFGLTTESGYAYPIPEPSTLALLSMATLALTLGWWRRRRAA